MHVSIDCTMFFLCLVSRACMYIFVDKLISISQSGHDTKKDARVAPRSGLRKTLTPLPSLGRCSREKPSRWTGHRGRRAATSPHFEGLAGGASS
jgi:hypothetical protein